MRRGSKLVLLLLLQTPGLASAHDFWVEPEAFEASPDRRVRVDLKVGSKKDVKSLEYKPDRILRFEGLSGTVTRSIDGTKGRKPAGIFDTSKLRADAILVYQSNHAYIELPAQDFERYLEHEGLIGIATHRRTMGQSTAVGRESYARSCKALLTIGEPDDAWRRTVGLPLEITPLVDPRRPNKELRFVVRWREGPLVGARVDLMALTDLEVATATTANERGEVRFPAAEPGRYMVATTHMFVARPPVRGDWESVWSTFAFEIRESPSAPR